MPNDYTVTNEYISDVLKLLLYCSAFNLFPKIPKDQIKVYADTALKNLKVIPQVCPFC